MCINWFRQLFHKPKTPAQPDVPPVELSEPAKVVPPPPSTLPHPEEPANPEQTMTNVNIDDVFQKWYDSYSVPNGNRSHFRNKIVVELSDTIPYPAGTWEVGGIRHLQIRPEWCNAGVIAHEEAHCSYALLNESQKDSFETAYSDAQSDPYITLLHTVNTYMNQLDSSGRHVEGHAEIYRYIGLENLPETLKQFYPKLI